MPTEKVSEFISQDFNKVETEDLNSEKKEYEMFATEFLHVESLVKDGLKFDCPQATELINILTQN